jgi:hypothetical protein
MVFLFRSKGCPACHQLTYDFLSGEYNSWASHVKFVDVEFNEVEQCDKAYIDGEPTEGSCPVDAVPALYLTESEELIYGYSNIKERLLNEYK